MRVFYIGQLFAGGTCLDRMQCIERLGHTVVPFDTTAYYDAGHLWIRSVGSRLNLGPYVNKLNRDLIQAVKIENNFDMIWVDKGNWIRPFTLNKMKELTRARLIHYTPDWAFKYRRSSLFLDSVPLFDHCFTTKAFEVDDYVTHKARRVHLTQQAFEQSRFYPRPKVKRYESDVCFIGHFEIHYARRLKAVSNIGARLAIWGPGWPRYSKLAKWCRKWVKGNGIWGEEYPRALCSAEICLGLLSKKNPDTSTTRTFEIPACGSFLLAERTIEHESFFIEDKEAVYFNSDSELVEKVGYYLAHSGERKRIARVGNLRSRKSNYSNDACMKHAFDIIGKS